MKKILTVVFVIAMMLSLSIVAGAEENKVITITTAEELAGMSDDLTADYVLDADIDLAGIAWTPIGTYKPSGESEEEQEIPASDTAFTGTFDGQGHIIRNSSAEKADDETAAAAEKLLEDVSGTYDALFPVITSPEYDQIWLDSCAAVLGDEAAPAAAEALKAACNRTIYGQEAIDAYGDGSNGAQFDCLFINGPAQIVFNGRKISGLDKSGATVFSHEYSFVEPASIAGMMNGYLYHTEDADAGEFEYFFLLPDTPGTTFHTEFRSGSDPEAMMLYNDGPYAYWLAAGILADRDEQMVQDVIDLFCTENLAEMSEEAAA